MHYEAMPQFSPPDLFLPLGGLLKNTQLAKIKVIAKSVDFFQQLTTKQTRRYVLNV